MRESWLAVVHKNKPHPGGEVAVPGSKARGRRALVGPAAFPSAAMRMLCPGCEMSLFHPYDTCGLETVWHGGASQAFLTERPLSNPFKLYLGA